MSTKKALKQQFREMEFRKGVYQLRNLHNNKMFIGSSMDVDRAWNSLRVQLISGNHANTGLQQDWNTLGEGGFAYEIVEILQVDADPQADVKAALKTLETLVMMELTPYGEKGYHVQKS
ncbi:GIY-YIG nuclease family protein [Chitinophaga sp. Cy-1792]|uniref:GIY-YIG nuclease family protein n=1 Tax=Chitinophaga sp. Cy-1792 TaxID=2608339 RepID=UPI001424389F|nr:GIY-YIG nuclease family protein [Chitinophaga sp. Cy-1792]NIG55674.1 GIY-YIG nuclease family protein [Chitinophaga sp. Cy-1792]